MDTILSTINNVINTISGSLLIVLGIAMASGLLGQLLNRLS